ncbi:hypothetical protein EV652_103398 [Kribbella steppae]|uniref:ParB-like nuclease family protein n=1 Tax=Kribbella steppae TaxID=2512223 RepID=A0A4R2HQQ1_9ACTN|nr:hypothetical protein [Kribbella steppae]TCO33397.1 hypothetical protein EV652_103398 [Kribbella steppae]
MSAEECNRLTPDHHYDSTLENLETYGASPVLPCWQLERVPVDGVDPRQRLEDQLGGDSADKVDSIRTAIRAGEALPPVNFLHNPSGQYPYFLLEGLHRFNATCYEQQSEILAWVAHIACCGGPGPDL